MFSFLKSKKGFTLVELMIVVVIMAILVAVAVPIYSAVTANARKKTCIGNQREIIASVGNWLMLNEKINISGEFDITNSDGVGAFGALENATGISAADFEQIKGCFKTIPFCPDTAGVVTVEIVTANSSLPGSFATCTTSCTIGDHVLPVNA